MAREWARGYWRELLRYLQQSRIRNHQAKIKYADARLRDDATPRFSRIFQFYRDTASLLSRITGQLLHYTVRTHCQETQGP